MGELIDAYRSVRNKAWFYSVLLLAVIPLFPDYVSFPLCFVSLFLAYRDAHQRGKSIACGKLGLIMLALLGYMAISIVYSSDTLGSMWSWLMWLSMFAAYLSLATVLTSRYRLRTALLCMTVVMGVIATMAVGQYILRETFGLAVHYNFWEPLDRIVYGALDIPLSVNIFGIRICGTFNNPNLLAAYLVLVIPFAVAFTMTGKTSKPKAWARIALTLAAYALGFSFSRGGYIALIVVGLLLMAMYLRKKFIMTVLTTLCIILLIPPTISNRLLSVIPSNVQDSAVSVEELENELGSDGDLSIDDKIEILGESMAGQYKTDDSVRMRFVMWKEILHNFLRHPLLGTGAGVCTTQDTLQAAGLGFKHAHNLFLEILSEGGLIALALFGCILYVLIKYAWQMLHRRAHHETKLLGFAIIGSCIALLSHGVFDFALLTPRLISLAMILLGITDAAAHMYLKVPTTSILRRRADAPVSTALLCMILH